MLHEELSDEKQEVRDGNRVSVWRRSIVAIARRNGMDQRIVLPALVVVLLCAALIRMYGLDLQSLEADEIFTIGIADSDNSLLEVLSIPLHNTPMAKPALYFLMTHFFLRLQDHDFLLRFPSMAFGVLGIAATYAVGAALFGKKEGLVAAFLLCISPLHVRYSQWSRFYTTLITFSLLSLLLLYRGMYSGGSKRWAGFIGATVLNLYTHLFAFLVLLSEGVFFAVVWLRDFALSRGASRRARDPGSDQFHKRRIFVHKHTLLNAILSVVIISIAYLPMAPHVLASLIGPKGLAEEAETPGMELSLAFFRSLLTEWSAGSAIGLLVFAALFLVGIVVSLKSDRLALLLGLLWMVVPLAVLFAAPLQHRFYSRYLAFQLPIYLIFVARGLTGCGSAIGSVFERSGGGKGQRSCLGLSVGVIILGAVSLWPLEEYYGERLSDWRAAGNFVADMMLPGEQLIVRRPGNQIALAHYDERLEEVDCVVARPRDPLPSDLRHERGIWFVGKEGRKNEMSGLEEELAALGSGPLFKMVFEGHGDHTAPGAGESMFWDVWVLYARDGMDSDEVLPMYERALDMVPAYASDFVRTAVRDLAPE
jgi:hypothetical protein